MPPLVVSFDTPANGGTWWPSTRCCALASLGRAARIHFFAGPVVVIVGAHQGFQVLGGEGRVDLVAAVLRGGVRAARVGAFVTCRALQVGHHHLE